MEFLGKLELFSRTFDNRFVFSLFDALLCGVIVLVIIRGWRQETTFSKALAFSAGTKVLPTLHQLLLPLAFSCLGASFALEAIFAGASFFLRSRLPAPAVELLFHTLQAGAWLLLAMSAYSRPAPRPIRRSAFRRQALLPGLLLALLGLSLTGSLFSNVTIILDFVSLALLVLVLILFFLRPLGGRHFATGAMVMVLVAAALHLSSVLAPDTEASVILWNLEQFAWSFSLFTLALAIGETSQGLFDKVFVRLQIAFILLASLMILVITQTEKKEYLAGLRGRSEQIAELVREQVDHFRGQNESLATLIEREDFLQRAMLGFGNLPELKVIRIVANSQIATFELADNREIHRDLTTIARAGSPTRLAAEEYFLIHQLPLLVDRTGEVAFYSTREFLDQHISKRIIVIFSLFTGVVALSTFMLGLVVRGASATIRQQAREIEQTQQQLLQSSKLAAIGELAAGVAHEINNPATTILSRASFLLSCEEVASSPSEREDLQAIVSQAQRIANITSSLLRTSRPQALEIKPVPIERLILAGLGLVDELLTTRHILVEKDVPPHLPRVLADEEKLARALENLFRNAIDAMPDGGRLSLKAAREDAQSMRLEIADTGTGIAGENLTRIFDPFFTTKEVGKGTGLGLSIVHAMIKEHRGTITAESEPGISTKFIIVLLTEESLMSSNGALKL